MTNKVKTLKVDNHRDWSQRILTFRAKVLRQRKKRFLTKAFARNVRILWDQSRQLPTFELLHCLFVCLFVSLSYVLSKSVSLLACVPACLPASLSICLFFSEFFQRVSKYVIFSLILGNGRNWGKNLRCSVQCTDIYASLASKETYPGICLWWQG